MNMNMNATDMQTVVIVGTGLAGGNAAVTLRQEGWRGRIILLGSEPTIPFGRPPLSKTYLRGEEDLSDWIVKPADWYEEHDIEMPLCSVWILPPVNCSSKTTRRSTTTGWYFALVEATNTWRFREQPCRASINCAPSPNVKRSVKRPGPVRTP